jgi:hypothetical protein
MPNVSVELNFFYMHYNDAKKFAEWATEKREDNINPSIYVRHAIISVVFASEALINRVIAEFATDSNLSEILERASILDKWYIAPFLCSGSAKPTPFDKAVEPYQSFKELIHIRNWLAHPKVETFLKAKVDPNSGISVGSSNEEYPWLEMLKGEQWPQTGIPKNPFEIDHTHAVASLKILDAMIEALSTRLAGQMHEGWLDLITVKDDEELHQYKAPVFTIWGGYGGEGS